MRKVLLNVGSSVAAGAVSYGVVQAVDTHLGILSKVLVVMAVGALGFAIAWESTQTKRGGRPARADGPPVGSGAIVGSNLRAREIKIVNSFNFGTTKVASNIDAKKNMTTNGIDVKTPAGSSPKVASDIKPEEGSVEIVDVHLRPTPRK